MAAFVTTHKYGYLIMHFECSECGTRDQIWNSRDGSVHLNVPCRHPACTGVSSHVDYHKSIRRKNFTLRPEQRYFTDMTLERAALLAKTKVDGLLDREVITIDQASAKLEQYTRAFFKDGKEPDLLTWYEPNK